LDKVIVEEKSVSYKLSIRNREPKQEAVPSKQLRTIYREHSAMLDDPKVR
jgi:hypothetical protein